MSIKQNINRIHVELSNNFESVKIEEKSNIKFGNYFEISLINEGLELKMIVSKRDLESNNIKWLYFANPLDNNSHLVERVSNINNITNDVFEVLSKKRFSEDYLNYFQNK
jgi:hypothetical protein